ncbi:hypothetical protein BDR26DRAFT_856584 [Obelidium mucronatum]|nr:hypothetical protein BDR26DRAFT_856584 [Obelidium mucronatum]
MQPASLLLAVLAAMQTTAQVAPTVSIPPIALWPSSPGTISIQVHKAVLWNKCWEASTYTKGAWLKLSECNPGSPFQAFFVVKQPSAIGGKAYVMMISDGTTSGSLCVEKNAANFMTLQPCRSGYGNQVIDLDINGTPTVAGSCLAPAQVSGIQAIGKFGNVSGGKCLSTYALEVNNLGPIKPAFLATPDAITSLLIGGQCVTGMKPNDPYSNLITNVYTTTCNGQPEQNWLYQFGQIKNVATGLCLNAPAATADAAVTDVVDLTLAQCNGENLFTQMWQREAGDILFNLRSYNCVRNVNGILRLGSGQCGKFGTDSLAAYPNTVTGLAAFVPVLPKGACKTLDKRRDYRDLSSAEKLAFQKGLQAMRECPSMLGRKSRWDDYNAFHGNALDWYHIKSIFLPWHRFLIWSFEQDMKVFTNNPNFAMPYWAWGSNPTNWATAEGGMLTPSEFGFGWDGVDSHYCLRDGFAGSWVPNDDVCIRRMPLTSNAGLNYAGRPQLTDQFMLAVTQMNPATEAPYTNFDDARWSVEYAHNMVHANVGGYYFYDMSNPNDLKYVVGHMFMTATAASDPIFYMHHVNIDRYYAMIQQFNPNLGYTGGVTHYPPTGGPGAPNGVPATLNDIMPGFNVPVSAGWDFKANSQCFEYIPYSKSQVAVNVQPEDVLLGIFGTANNGADIKDFFAAGALGGKLSNRRRDANIAVTTVEEAKAVVADIVTELNVVTSTAPVVKSQEPAQIGTKFPDPTPLEFFYQLNMPKMVQKVAKDHAAFEKLNTKIVDNTIACLANLGKSVESATVGDHAVGAACALIAVTHNKNVTVSV